jgi:two-component system, LytTR family, sensor kinase
MAALVVSAIRYLLMLTLFPQFSATERLLFSALSLFFIVIVWEGVHAFNRYLNYRVPFETNALRRFFIQAAGCLAVMLIIHTSLVVYFEPYYAPYFPPQIATAIKVASYFLDLFIVLAINTAYFGFYFFDKWKKNLLERETWQKEKALLQKEQLTAQYENLKNQLNPHFLFNSLSSLDSLIDENPDLARQFLQQLAKVFRYMLQHKETELVTLETELNFIRHYVTLLETRFQQTFRLECTVASDALERRIVPVTLQILIENAIKHNVVSAASPLVMRLKTDNGYLEISNTVQAKKQISTSNGQGLQNLRQLYRFLSGREVEVLAGTDFVVRVPLL